MSNITVTRVGVTSIAKLVGTVNLIVAVAVGVIAAIVATINYLNTGIDGFFDGLIGSLVILVVALVVYPLLMFGLGWLYGALVSFIFNVVIGVSGGVDVEVTENKKK